MYILLTQQKPLNEFKEQKRKYRIAEHVKCLSETIKVKNINTYQAKNDLLLTDISCTTYNAIETI